MLFQFNQGDRMRQELGNVTVEIQGVADAGAQILQVTDVSTQSVNDRVTPGRNLRIVGSKIKVDGTDESIGVYFVNTVNGTRTKVPNNDIVNNLPSQLLIFTPALAAGTYQLEVVTQYANGGKNLVSVRTLTFDRILTVA